MEFLRAALSSLPAIARQPLAIVAYVVVVGAWLLVALRVKRNAQLLDHLRELPEADRLKALQIEIGHVDVRGGLSAEQYLRSRRYVYYLIGFLVTLLFVLIFGLVVWRRAGTLDIDITPRNSGVPAAPRTSPIGVLAFLGSPPSVIDDDDLVQTSEVRDGVTHLGYRLPYLDTLRRGGIIFARSGLADSLLPWRPTELAVKVVNNSEKTMILSKVQVTVTTSTVDKEPVPVFVFNPFYLALHTIFLKNEGWSPMEDTAIEVSFLKGRDVSRAVALLDKGEEKRVRFEVGRVADEDTDVDVGSAIPASWRTDTSTATAYGILVYRVGMMRRRVKFVTLVMIRSVGPGMRQPASAGYDIFFPAGKAGYVKSIPIAQKLGPGEADEFILYLTTDMTSRTQFVLSLLTVDGVERKRQSFDVEFFKPRSVQTRPDPLSRPIYPSLDRARYREVANAEMINSVLYDREKGIVFVILAPGEYYRLEADARKTLVRRVLDRLAPLIKSDRVTVRVMSEDYVYENLPGYRLR